MFQLEEKIKSKILDFKIFKKQDKSILESVFFSCFISQVCSVFIVNILIWISLFMQRDKTK